MIMPKSKVKGIILRTILNCHILLGFWLGLMPVTPAWAQGGGPAMIQQPATPPAEEKEAAPTTCGPMISDTCQPIERGKFAMQVWWALSFYRGCSPKTGAQ
jgi:hypothetical protein